MQRKKASDFDQRALDLYDDYAHGRISRRDFAQRIATVTLGSMTAEAVISSLAPNYAWAQQVAPDDPRIVAQTYEYASPKGGGKISGALARPAKEGQKFPAVVVIHENRGLNPYIADVARRLATEGFLALAPDALSPLGGYPGNDDEGRTMQAKRNPDEMFQDFVAAAETLRTHELSTGKVGAVGFCYGGGVVNQLMVSIPETVIAGVPFYGRQPNAADVPKIKGSLLIQYAELDTRINEGWPAFEDALKAAGTPYEMHMYPATNHGFHNDSTPRYDEAAAKLAWQRTVDFFKAKLA
jgi:carboxymethylenebutenolidase